MNDSEYFSNAEKRERTVMTALFSELKIKNYQFSEIGSYCRYDARLKGQIFGESRTTNYLFEIKCRSQESKSYGSVMVAIDKVAYLLLEAFKNNTKEKVVYAHYFPDNVVALVEITPTILNLPVEELLYRDRNTRVKHVSFIRVPFRFCKMVRFSTLPLDLF